MKRHAWFLGLGLILTSALVLPSCGDDDGGSTDDAKGGEGNSTSQGGASAGRGGRAGTSGAGVGGSTPLPNVPCGDALCEPRTLPGYPGIPACCADADAGRCGLDTSLLETFGGEPTRACEPLDQPGELDEDCPQSPEFQQGALTLPPFSGCCNAETGACGYMIDRVLDVLPIGLGCVDSTPFLDGASPAPCNPAAGGANGAGGAANGAGGASAGSGGNGE